MRKQIAAANWKMNLTLEQGLKLVDELLSENTELQDHQEVVFGIPFPYLIAVKEKIKDHKNYFDAAQNCYFQKSGAYTGEVSAEMLDELQEAITRGDNEEVKLITSDIKLNLEKIIHHGKRADAIVKAMLLHSRSNSGQKEPTDINSLTDEYLRLSYHGLRGKDKTFNATLQTDFDESIGKLNIIQQDIGRVILNIITNAFYSVTEKKKMHPQDYEPTVSVTTKKNGSKAEIHIKDNGLGIPQKVLEKIYQPFFTTKPTGQGTGLGLSLSYDIIKAHSGTIKVETKEGEYAEFIITLPL